MQRPIRSLPAILVAAAVAVAVLPGCDNAYYVDPPRRFWAVSVDNRTGITLDIHLDGGFVATVTSGTVGTVPAVPQGSHELVALDADRQVRARRSFYLDRDFLWLLE